MTAKSNVAVCRPKRRCRCSEQCHQTNKTSRRTRPHRRRCRQNPPARPTSGRWSGCCGLSVSSTTPTDNQSARSSRFSKRNSDSTRCSWASSVQRSPGFMLRLAAGRDAGGSVLPQVHHPVRMCRVELLYHVHRLVQQPGRLPDRARTHWAWGDALFPAAMALISDYHSRATRSRAMSWHQSAVYAGTILGSWLTASVAERMGWQYPFYFLARLESCSLSFCGLPCASPAAGRPTSPKALSRRREIPKARASPLKKRSRLFFALPRPCF